MAECRWHIKKNGLMVEHKNKENLLALRKADSRFKRARIKHVLQMFPNKVIEGKVYSEH